MIQEDDIETTALELATVYGHLATFWTEHKVGAPLYGSLVLSDPDDQVCNALYMGEVVHVFIIAVVHGEAFVISDAGYQT